MAWSPKNEFEEEIVAFDVDCNFIFGSLSDPKLESNFQRPQETLDYLPKKGNQLQKCEKNHSINEKLRIIDVVQKITGTKRLGEQATLSDWDNRDNVERETVAMLRHFGYSGPQELSVSEIASRLPKNPNPKSMCIMHAGWKRMPILFDEKYFKLRPLVRTTTDSVKSNSEKNEIDESDESVNTTDEVIEKHSQLISVTNEPVCEPLSKVSVDENINKNIDIHSEHESKSPISTNKRGNKKKLTKVTLFSNGPMGNDKKLLSANSLASGLYENGLSPFDDRLNTACNGSIDNESFIAYKNNVIENLKKIFYTSKELYEKKRMN